MKRTFIIIALATLVQPLVAQNDYRLGLRFAPNLVYMPLDDASFSSGTHMQYGFGLSFDSYFDERYAVSTGIDIINLQSSIARNDTSMGFQASYIQIPIAFRMKTVSIGYWSFFARFGLSLGYKYQESVDYSHEDLSIQDGSQVDNFLFTFLGTVGAEYELGIGSSLYFSVDYNQSLLNNLNPRNFPMLENEQPRFHWFNLSVGIIF